MDVSVIVCTRNRAGYLPVLLQSLEALEIPSGLSWEVLVVDNGSADGTRRIVEEWEPRLPLRYLFEGRIGKSHALNTGIAAAKGEVLAFTDDDAWVDRKWLAALWTASRREGFFFGGGPVVPVWKCQPPRWLAVDGPFRIPVPIIARSEPRKERSVPFTPCGANLFLHRETAIRNGPFRTDLGPGASGASEDTEFCVRLERKGMRPVFVPEAKVYHPVESFRLGRDALIRWRFACGRSEMRWRGVAPGTVCILGVPRYLFRRLAESLALWWVSLDPQKRFYYRCRWAYTLGEIVERFGRHRPGEGTLAGTRTGGSVTGPFPQPKGEGRGKC